ncbi:MAG: hypothetical protein N2170_06640 [Bacteroidia bacterium]|nr:hypothetical protein [Bacteroidia bacterium]
MGNNLYVDSIQVRESSIASLSSNHHLHLFLHPNPAVDDVYLTVQGRVHQVMRYRIFSAQGVELSYGTLMPQAEYGQYKFSVAALAAGLYLIPGRG